MGKKIHKDVSLTAALAPYFRIFVANWNTDVEGRPTTPTVEILYEETDDEGTVFSLWFKSRAWAYAFGADWGIALVQNIHPMIAAGITPGEEGAPNE